MFINSQSVSQASGPALTDTTIAIVKTATLSTSTLYLFVAAFWNSKLDLATLKQTTANRIPSRSSSFIFIQFNFLYQKYYPNWADIASSIDKLPLTDNSS